jgi:hypothetical protein
MEYLWPTFGKLFIYGGGDITNHVEYHWEWIKYIHIILKTCGYTTNLAFECNHTFLLECVENVSKG